MQSVFLLLLLNISFSLAFFSNGRINDKHSTKIPKFNILKVGNGKNDATPDTECIPCKEIKNTDSDGWREFGSRPDVRKAIALASCLFGAFLFFTVQSQPVSGLALLKAMESDSMSIDDALCNGKPTLVDFYADWCQSCKIQAPVMRSLEAKFKNDINFVVINGVNPQNQQMVDKFRVDGIPHVAFLTSNAEVKTALVGAVPQKYLEADMKALKENKPLPYEGYDAFEEESHFPLNTENKICKADSSN